MLRIVIIICLCLFVAIACEQAKKTDQSTTQVDSSATSTLHHPLPPCPGGVVTMLKTPTNSVLIDSARAARLYINFKEKAMKGRKKFGANFCDSAFRYLKTGRFIKGTLEEHLCINETSLRRITGDTVQYDAVRLYPCLDGKDLKYLLVFVKQVSGEATIYNDKSSPTPIVLLTLDKLRKRICAIYDYQRVGKVPFTSHRLCTPNCPDDDDDLLFDY
ncbi:hypothetical protein [Fibrella arboris]|uniref:hypothetical protein n=1 Tax=Fibrella arboris TaxID=3242486 RepID=UPI003520D971